jgi:hypothetical protein
MPLHATFVDFVADVTPQQSAPPPLSPAWHSSALDLPRAYMHMHTCARIRTRTYARTNECVRAHKNIVPPVPASTGWQ